MNSMIFRHCQQLRRLTGRDDLSVSIDLTVSDTLNIRKARKATANTNGISAVLSLCGRNAQVTTNNIAMMAVAKKYLRTKPLRRLDSRKKAMMK